MRWVAAALALLAVARPVEAEPSDKPKSGRAEWAFGQAVNGILLGFEVCEWRHCRRNAEANVALPLALVGGFSVFLVPNVTMGEAMAVNSGAAFGAWHGAALADALGRDGFGGALAGQLGGTMLGLAATRVLDVRSGRIALANTLGAWAGATMALWRYNSGNAGGLPNLAAADLAWAAGYALWPGVQSPRYMALFIDLAGFGGLAAGGLFGLFRDGDGAMGRTAAGTAAVMAGVAAWAVLSGNPPPPEHVQWHLVPQPDGLALRGSW